MRAPTWTPWLVGIVLLTAACNLSDDGVQVQGSDADASVEDASDVASDSVEQDMCDGGAVCGQACVDLTSNSDHCGACDRSCTAPNAVSSGCESSTCQFECEAGFVDANQDLGDPEGDGCEATCVPTEDRTEICDGEDNDCDGEVDEGARRSWYLDSDGDGFGQDANPRERCDRPSPRYVETSGDCDDGDPDINPDATEVCDEVDNDCDGMTDEDVETEYYQDEDGDGFGTESVTQMACSAPEGFVETGGDCDDSDDAVRPDQEQYFQQERASGGFDYDCSGTADKEVDAVSETGCAYIGRCGRIQTRCAPSANSAGWLDTVPDCGDAGQRFAGCASCVSSGTSCSNAASYVEQVQRCR